MTPVPVTQILRTHGRVFASPRASEEDSIEDLNSLPLRDEGGRPIPIYNEEGNPIPRQRAVPDEGANPAGVFLSLNKVSGLFQEQYMDREARRYVHSNQIDLYPVGHVAGVGCIQTRQPLPLLSDVIRNVNIAVGAMEAPQSDDEGAYEGVNEDGELEPIRRSQKRPVYATHTQAYNLSNHFFAPRANENRITHGQVTAAASGFFAMSGLLPTTSTSKNHAQKAADKIQMDLPFQVFEAQMEGYIPTALRLEEVVVIDWMDVDEIFQTGT